MVYYLVKNDFYDHFKNYQYIGGELVTENKIKRANFCQSDLEHYFVKVETPKTNTFTMFGVRKPIKWSLVKEIK